MNARSLKSVNKKCNKLIQLSNLAGDLDSDIFAITETWFNDNISNSEVLNQNYIIYRRDRVVNCQKRGGGILLAVKKCHRSSLILTHDFSEIISVLINDILFILSYRPPGSDVKEYVSNLNDVYMSAQSTYENICILGDFNFPDLKWDASIYNHVHNDNAVFVDFINTYGLVQLNTVPSNKFRHILDLVISNFPESFSEIKACEADFNTDHVILNFSVETKESKKQQLAGRLVYNYKQADFDKIKQALNAADLSKVLSESENVHSAWENWLQTVSSIIEMHVPKLHIRDKNLPEWFDKEVIHLRNIKNTAWRRAHLKNTHASWAKFRKVRNKIVNLVRQKSKKFINDLGFSVKENPKRFWSFVKSKTKSSSVPSDIIWGDKHADTSHDIAKLFNEYFVSVFKPSDQISDNINFVCNSPNIHLNNVVVTEKQVYDILCKLYVNKALGPDNLSPVVLKYCSNEFKRSVCQLINRSLSEGVVPKDWLFANVIPVYKSKDKNQTSNYRPISLLSLISKVAERCIYNHIYPHIVNLLHPSQHGFLSGKSTATQLVQFLMDASSSIDNSSQIDVIYTDFAKAFDSVSHKLLLEKLCKIGFNGNLLQWLNSYLSNRYQRVLVNGVASDWVKVTSGVPQGSILGPVLFLIFINDLPEMLNYCKPLLFADDAKIFASKIQSFNDCTRIQDDLNALSDWCITNKLDLNVLKCKVMCITRSRSPIYFKYCIKGEPIERVSEMKDLGVVIENTLSWNNHVNKIIAKANRILGLIKRTVGFNAPEHVKLQLYQSLVRSNLEYCSQAWNGLTITNRVKLERVQRAATRYILNFPDMSYVERLSKTNLLPLSFRRDVLDLKFLYKCINGQYHLNAENFINFTSNSNVATRSADDPSLIKPPYCKTTTFQRAYFNRMYHSWNILPTNIRNATSVESFSRKLKKFLYLKVQNFNPECCCCMYTNNNDRCNCFR